jgi:hypothetical protein
MRSRTLKGENELRGLASSISYASKETVDFVASLEPAKLAWHLLQFAAVVKLTNPHFEHL